MKVIYPKVVRGSNLTVKLSLFGWAFIIVAVITAIDTAAPLLDGVSLILIICGFASIFIGNLAAIATFGIIHRRWHNKYHHNYLVEQYDKEWAARRKRSARRFAAMIDAEHEHDAIEAIKVAKAAEVKAERLALRAIKCINAVHAAKGEAGIVLSNANKKARAAISLLAEAKANQVLRQCKARKAIQLAKARKDMSSPITTVLPNKPLDNSSDPTYTL